MQCPVWWLNINLWIFNTFKKNFWAICWNQFLGHNSPNSLKFFKKCFAAGWGIHRLCLLFTCLDNVFCCWPFHHFRFCSGRYFAATQNRAAVMIFIVSVIVILKIYSIFLLWLCTGGHSGPHTSHTLTWNLLNITLVASATQSSSNICWTLSHTNATSHTTSIKCISSELFNNPKASFNCN